MFNIFLRNQYLVLKTIPFEATILAFNSKIDSNTKIYNSTYFYMNVIKTQIILYVTHFLSKSIINN